MRYRATLCGLPDQERAQVEHSNSLAVLEKWAQAKIDALSKDERDIAFVKVEEVKYELVCQYAERSVA